MANASVSNYPISDCGHGHDYPQALITVILSSLSLCRERYPHRPFRQGLLSKAQYVARDFHFANIRNYTMQRYCKVRLTNREKKVDLNQWISRNLHYTAQH